MDNEKARLAELMILFGAYPNLNLTKEQMKQTGTVYMQMLADLPLDELRIVFQQCITECKFLPTIAEIRERHRALSGGLGIQTAADAWVSVQRAIREVGYMSLPKFSNAITAKTVEALGWRNLCESESPEIDRAQFERFYNSMLNRQTDIERLLPAAREMLEDKAGTNAIVAQLAEGMRMQRPPARPVKAIAVNDDDCPF